MSALKFQPPAILAVDPLPVELTAPGGVPAGLGQDSQVTPLLIAAVLLILPLGLWLSQRARTRRKRMPHRPRNPTLAETGGLPPPRSPEPPRAP
jgi:hypothetical protein